MVHGVINIHKEKGFTSHDVVAKLRGIVGQKKIGHTGTLDPDATGVLPVCLGKATKVCDLLTDKDKEYKAVLLLGQETDTQDISGEVLNTSKVSVSEDEVKKVILSFVGEYQQVPPMYSALKVNGQKLCDLARQGKEVERKPRTITIHKLECLEFTGETARLLVHCSKGTYIRTLCKDIGEALGCGGCMASLRRVTAGEYTIEEAVPLQELLDTENPEQYLRQVDTMFRNHPAVTLTPNQEKRCRNGNAFSIAMDDGTYRAYSQTGEFLMLAKVEAGTMTTIKSFFEV
jgi:tRNA pseudouridine55 synthase